jgi:hypothetical protein
VTIERWMPAAAARLGLTAEQYAAHLAGGKRWCTPCGGWHPTDDFDEDKTRRTGYAKRCRRSKQRVPRLGPPKIPPSRSAWVAVDRAGLPVALWPGSDTAERAARSWIRKQDRDDLTAVPLRALRLPTAAAGRAA